MGFYKPFIHSARNNSKSLVDLGRTLRFIYSKPASNKWARFIKWYRRLWGYEIPEPELPYSHICQIGDPILRSTAMPVLPDQIKTQEIQKVINAMRATLKRYDAVGISAPQIGVPLRIILVDFSQESLMSFNPETRRIREMEVSPPQLILNPSVTVLDHRKTCIFLEGCASVQGFSASVKRFHTVRVEGLNEMGEPTSWITKGWLARIVQHEMDHLDGRMYTDIMDAKTFQCQHWYIFNHKKGRYRIPYK